ncbi:SPC12-domain-containing protein [Cryphonectria parasitica EP155]|uniref:Signal peptidase complex subunit 1 n=1 Tax=Cryphonectria parasitica (strain ATCC 38755 / EP155) TaxID=660469 RepID=A0A9P4YC68_CRYP1|nr:SPC12-domain-containing protein [Cryphonectria parasitica EP155]KAF3770309.1 SPC12-domain-containing protein [Cryphonectria parasitica EP155]
MAEELLDQVRDVAEGQIDFEGQKLVETLSTVLLSVIGVSRESKPRGSGSSPPLPQAISFLVGYFLQDIKLAVFIALGGTGLTFLVVVPPWPFYKKHPVKWLPVSGGTAFSVPQNLVIDEKVTIQ